MTHDCLTHFCIHDSIAIGIAVVISSWAIVTTVKHWRNALR